MRPSGKEGIECGYIHPSHEYVHSSQEYLHSFPESGLYRAGKAKVLTP